MHFGQSIFNTLSEVVSPSLIGVLFQPTARSVTHSLTFPLLKVLLKPNISNWPMVPITSYLSPLKPISQKYDTQ